MLALLNESTLYHIYGLSLHDQFSLRFRVTQESPAPPCWSGVEMGSDPAENPERLCARHETHCVGKIVTMERGKNPTSRISQKVNRAQKLQIHLRLILQQSRQEGRGTETLGLVKMSILPKFIQILREIQIKILRFFKCKFDKQLLSSSGRINAEEEPKKFWWEKK